MKLIPSLTYSNQKQKAYFCSFTCLPSHHSYLLSYFFVLNLSYEQIKGKKKKSFTYLKAELWFWGWIRRQSQDRAELFSYKTILSSCLTMFREVYSVRDTSFTRWGFVNKWVTLFRVWTSRPKNCMPQKYVVSNLLSILWQQRKILYSHNIMDIHWLWSSITINLSISYCSV